MAWFVRITQTVIGLIEPLKILVFIPPMWIFVNAGLVLSIAGALELKLGYRLLVMVCFSLSPLTQVLHGVGRIDHHYFEFTLVLLSCLVGLYWFKSPNSKSLSTACGIGLGIGIAFHNGLFLLQVPLLVSMGLLWMKGIALPRQAVSRFAIALVATSFLMALPSIPFSGRRVSHIICFLGFMYIFL